MTFEVDDEVEWMDNGDTINGDVDNAKSTTCNCCSIIILICVLSKKTCWWSSEGRNDFNDLGYVWDPREAMWEEGFNHLVAYKEESGDCLVKFKSKYCGHNLGMWVNAQRAKKDKLTPQRFKRLDDLGFVWKTR